MPAVAVRAHLNAAADEIRDCAVGVSGVTCGAGFVHLGAVEHLIRRRSVILVGHVSFAGTVTRRATDAVCCVRHDQRLAVEVKVT